MTDSLDPVYRVLWTDNLEDVDREIAKLAQLCQVKILDPGVMGRVLKKDASVCGTPNASAFAKLRDLLLLHMGIHEKSVASFGQGATFAMEDYIIERLRKSYPELSGPWPPR